MGSRHKTGIHVVGVAVVLTLVACVYSACTDSYGESTETADASTDGATSPVSDGGTNNDAAVCVPPTCNGTGGRCGKVAACGLEFQCGDCTPPNTCAGGTCVCVTGVTCNAAKAKCGQIDDGCEKKVDCGACDAGSSCQKDLMGALDCKSGQCMPEKDTVTCDGFCKSNTNNCGMIVTCSDTCASMQICGGGGTTTKCGCPMAPVAIRQFVNATNYHCYSEGTSCPPSFTAEKIVAKLYASQYPGTVPLYRCKAMSGTQTVFVLTTSAACESLPGFTLEGAVGFCASQPGLCGAIALRRFVNNGTGDFINSIEASVPNHTLVGDTCFVLQ